MQTLDGEYHDFVDEKPPYEYYVKDEIDIQGKTYRLIWLIEEDQSYIGVINAFRNSK